MGFSFSDIEPILRQLRLRFGSIVTLYMGSHPSIFITTHALAHQALIQNGTIFADRPLAPPVSRVFSSNQHNIHTAAYGPLWRLLRRNLISEALNSARIKSYSKGREWALDLLKSRLGEESHSGEGVPVMESFQFSMSCLLLFMCFGEKLGEDIVREVETIQRDILIGFGRFSTPLNLFPRLGKIVFRNQWIKLLALRRRQEEILTPLIEAHKKICVAVRARPPISEETLNGAHWKVQENRISLHNALGTPISGSSYTFDHVFDQNCTNARVYELHTKDVIHAAVKGFNGTAFAYGQTSSGKTFTMNGSHNDPGIIPLAVQDIFQNIDMMNDREFLIRVSYMEIYNEEINDLFSPESNKLQIHESLERGIFVAGLREEIVNSKEQVLMLLNYGEVNRHVGQTNMNIRSSRSHTIFRMVIESRRKDTVSPGDILNTDAVRVSVLNLVDLAGSERIAKTGAGGVRLKEGKHINRSLMVLGTVINKLSDGGKQRGHIPYRDSKLTRILQPALGGNAKTSIICTVAPEEVHIDETRGTLQFASRAKRITNCVQVNEILTDAALLKRQKLEIEELRKKLQGSHSEVLEQEILKLRNGMLKYELEHEKLAMELEEERKSHKEREQCIREQQMKIDNLSSLVILSDRGSSAEGDVSTRLYGREECISNHVTQRYSFATPLKGFSNAFVAGRSNHLSLIESSPVPDDFVNIADEDLWMRLNKGHTTLDFDLLMKTPNRKYSSLASNDISKVSCSIEYYKEEVETLKRQLESALLEKDELEKKHSEQVSLNKQLMVEISELENEATLIKQIPQRMLGSVANCQDAYKMILSNIKSFAADQKSSNAKLLSCTTDIGMHLFLTLENHLSRAMDGHEIRTGGSSVLQDQSRILAEKMNCAISALISSECSIRTEGPALEDAANAGGKMEFNNQVVEVAKIKYRSLERECSLLKGERDSLTQTLSMSAQSIALLVSEREEIVKTLNKETHSRKNLEEELRRFGLAFAQRQGLFASLCSEFKSNTEKLRVSNSVSIPEQVRI